MQRYNNPDTIIACNERENFDEHKTNVKLFITRSKLYINKIPTTKENNVWQLQKEKTNTCLTLIQSPKQNRQRYDIIITKEGSLHIEILIS